MSYNKSFQDNLLDSLAPIKRKLQNIRTKYLGTKSQVLRVTLESQDSFGGKTYSYSSNIIDNVVIQFPFSESELFTGSDSSSIDILQYLPITMTIPFNISGESRISGQSVELQADDIIVQVLYDHNENKIPVTMRVSRGYGGMSGRHIIKRKYELQLMRGLQEQAIEDLIVEYISGCSL